MINAWGSSWGFSWGVSWGGLRVPTFQQIWVFDERGYKKKKKVKKAKETVKKAIEAIVDINQLIVKNTTSTLLLEQKLNKAAKQIEALEAETDFIEVQKRLLRSLELNLKEAIKQVQFNGLTSKPIKVNSVNSSLNVYEIAKLIEEQDDLETLQLFMMLV